MLFRSKGLGLCYLTDAVWDWHVDSLSGFVIAENGNFMNMPRYYKQKIFNKDERKEMKQEADLIRAMTWEDWCNFDYREDIERRKAAVRNHEKQQKLKRLKL